MLFDLLAPDHGSAPWPLTLHFTGFPSNQMPPCAGAASLRASMINSLKEASFVVCKSADLVNKATAAAKEELWAAVASGNAGRYAEIVATLQVGHQATGALPVRVLIRPAAPISSYEPVEETSRRVAGADASGKPMSLSAALTPIVGSWLAARGVSTPEKNPAWAWVGRALVGGVAPPPDAPLADLHRDLHAPDYFLYVVLHMKPL